MSQLQYYGQVPAPDYPHRRGLYAWGVALIVAGGLTAFGALFSLGGAVVLMSGVVPGMAGRIALLALGAVVMYAFISTALIWIGIGSCKARRWVRPLIIIASVLALTAGLASIVSVAGIATRQINHPLPPTTAPVSPGMSPATQNNVQLFGMLCGGVFAMLAFVVLPAILLWFYGRLSVQSTLDLMDPVTRWTDRCPLPVLGWSLYCANQSLGLMSILATGVFPFFSTILIGPPALIVAGTLILLLAVGAVLCYRQVVIGWLLTVASCMVLAASYLTFVIAGDHGEFLRLILKDLPEESRRAASQASGNSLIAPAVIYALAVLYAFWLWKRFRTPAVLPVFPVVT